MRAISRQSESPNPNPVDPKPTPGSKMWASCSGGIPCPSSRTSSFTQFPRCPGSLWSDVWTEIPFPAYVALTAHCEGRGAKI